MAGVIESRVRENGARLSNPNIRPNNLHHL